MKKYFTIIIVIMCCLLIACGNNENGDTEVVTAEEGDDTAKEFVISYEKKEYTPSVLVNQFGYEAEHKKEVYFLGEELANTFQVYEYETNLLVYEGKIEQAKEKHIFIGDFTELKQEGTYYIQTKKIGESYPFKIESEQSFEKIYHQLLFNFSEQDPKKYEDVKNMEELFPILIAHEMYPTAFFDGDIFLEPNKIPDILDYLTIVGKNRMEVGTDQDSIKNKFLEAAFFAKLAFGLENYDQENTKEFKSYAELRFKEAEALLKKEETETAYEDVAYFATAELYRLTGKYAYRNTCETYAKEISYSQEKNAYTFYADMTHMSTRRTVQVDFCNSRMELVRNNVIDWIANAGKNPFFYNADQIDTLLLYGMEILWVHEINYSEEYENLEREIGAYFTGLNREGVSYVSEIGYTISKDTFMESPKLNNKYLVLISRYMQQEEAE